MIQRMRGGDTTIVPFEEYILDCADTLEPEEDKMKNLFEYKGKLPVIADSATIYDTAEITGDVVVGENTVIASGVKIIGTTPESIDLAEDRDKFKRLLKKLGLRQPENGIATSFEQARKIAASIGFPVVVRPSYVLGGRAMEIVYNDEDLASFMARAVEASPEKPILVDKFLDDEADRGRIQFRLVDAEVDAIVVDVLEVGVGDR